MRAMRRNSRRLNRRSPARRCVDVGSPLERLERLRRRAPRGVLARRGRRRRPASRRRRAGAGATSPRNRLEPRIRHARSAAPVESRKVTASAALRVGPSASRGAGAARGRGRGSPRASRGSPAAAAACTPGRAGEPCGELAGARRGCASASTKPNAASRSSAASRAERPASGQRLEQRREEEPLVDRADRGLVRAVVLLERLECGGARPGRGSRATRASSVSVDVVAGERVGLLLVPELEAVLDGAQEDVRRRRVGRRRAVRRTHRRRAAPSATRVVARPDRSSWRPCTSCSSWTANSTSRIPPRPRLSSRSVRPFFVELRFGARLHRADLADRVGVEHARATRTGGSASMNASAELGRRPRPVGP